LGILPLRDAAEGTAETEDRKQRPPAGVVVRLVYPNSPAAKAGIKAGDHVESIDGNKVESIQSAIEAMNSLTPGAEIAVRLRRDDKPIDATIESDRLPTSAPSELPAAYAKLPPPPAEGTAKAALEIRDLKLAEFPQSCRVYLPPSHTAGRAAGVLLWLHAPGEPPNDDLFRQWQSICDRDGLIFVAPSAAEPSRWERTELEYLRRLTERVLAEYHVDRQRVVILGQEGGGALAYYLALMSRELFTGVATTAAALPRTIDPPQTKPTSRLAVFAGLPSDDRRLAQSQAGLKKLADAGYPVTAAAVANASGKLSVDEREQLARWIDSLDRF
jgi:predicted esterase